MTQVSFTGIPVEVTPDGYFVQPEQWSSEMAPEIAATAGIAVLTDEHWRVINYMRERFLADQRPPNLRMISRTCGVSIRQLYRLFPMRPIKNAAKIAGVPQPSAYVGGCGVNWRRGRSW